MAGRTMMTLTAFIMSDALKDGMNWSPSLMGLVRFGGLKMDYFPFILICLDAYVKGAGIGHTFRDNYDLLLGMLVSPKNSEQHARQMQQQAEKRLNNYDAEIKSIIDFVLTTELANDKNTFDDMVKQAKKKIKIDKAGPRLKQIFEEGIAFGIAYPEKVTKLFSLERRTSDFDWEQARLEGLKFNIESQEIDLKFLTKWARHNLGLYCRQYRPELTEPLGV